MRIDVSFHQKIEKFHLFNLTPSTNLGVCAVLWKGKGTLEDEFPLEKRCINFNQDIRESY